MLLFNFLELTDIFLHQAYHREVLRHLLPAAFSSCQSLSKGRTQWAWPRVSAPPWAQVLLVLHLLGCFHLKSLLRKYCLGL